MTVESAITAGFVAAANADRALRTLITGLATGNLSTLTTTNKASIIAAINELEDSINNVIDDLTDDSETTTYSALKIESRLIEIRDGILGGASAAYDTLLELQNEIIGNDSDIAAILTAVGNRVRFDAAQSLTGGQQTQARSNIGAASQADLTTTNSTATALAVRVTTTESDIDALEIRATNVETRATNVETLIANASGTDYATAFNTALTA